MAKGIYVAPTMEEVVNDPVGLEDFSSYIPCSIGSSGAPIGLPNDKNSHLPKGYEIWAHRQRHRERRDDPGHAGLPQWKVLRSIELFCAEVLPHFRAASAPAGR
jgi:hypothetical protein